MEIEKMEDNLSAAWWCQAIKDQIHAAVQRRATPERVAAWLARQSGAASEGVGAWLAANLTRDTNHVNRLEKSCHAKI